MSAPPMPRARQGILSLTIKKDKNALYAAYMQFVKNGGLFIPTTKKYNIGDEVFMLLSLMDETERLPVAGRIIWITRSGPKATARPGSVYSSATRTAVWHATRSRATSRVRCSRRNPPTRCSRHAGRFALPPRPGGPDALPRRFRRPDRGMPGRRRVASVVCVDRPGVLSPTMLALVEDYPEVSVSVGVHPNDFDRREPGIDELVRLAGHPKTWRSARPA